MSSPILYHGPGARQDALNAANSLGLLLAPPFGDDGLKVEQAREVVGLLQSAPTTESLGVVIIGPLDDAATGKSSDALLKTLEEPGDYVQAVLWAHDLGGVPLTIRSRSLLRFSPPGPSNEDEDDVLPRSAYTLVRAHLESDYATIIDTVNASLTKEKEEDSIAKGVRLVQALSDVLGMDLDDPHKRNLWEHLREVSLVRNPSAMEIISVLIGVPECQ